MRIFILILTSLFLLQYAHAQEEAGVTAKIVEEIALPGIASASGLESKGDFYYVIGDDSPWLYELDSTYKTTRKFLIHHHSFEGVDRIPGDVKPDYEAIVNYKWGSKDLLIFGSGSGPERKTMMRVDFTSRGYDVNEYTLEHLYDQIMKAGNLSPGQLNIEGAVSWRDHLVLMNRETNQLILIAKMDFERYMKMDPGKQAKKNLKINFYNFELPSIDGVQAQFSGGMKVSGEHVMVFTASVEGRSDSQRDGQILGSYVGLIPLKNITNGELQIAQVMKDGQPYIGKIESVDIEKVKDHKLSLNAVTDDDQGGSSFLRIKLTR